MKSRTRIVFKQTYKRGAFIKPHQFPTVPVLKAGSEIKDCELMAEGEVERNGERQQFIELRIYAGPKAHSSDEVTR